VSDETFYTGLTIYDSIGTLDGSIVSDRVYGLFNISNGANGTNPVGTTRLTETFWGVYIGRKGDTTGSTAADFFANSADIGGTAPNLTLASNLTQVYPDAFANQVFTNNFGATNISPTAAAVRVSGRVLIPKGRGIGQALVYLTDQNGENQVVLTNPFGYYHFENVLAGGTYIFIVHSKRYTFQPQVITVMEEMENLNFIAEP
jgi:hypothetical protein